MTNVTMIDGSPTSSLNSSKSGFDWQCGQFEKAKAQLYRPDGQPRYSAQEHNERLQSLLQPLTEAAASVKEAADAALEAAKMARVGEHADPLSTLSDSELSRAASLKGFVEDYLSSTALDRVGLRLAAVAASGNKGEIAAYYVATNKRIDVLRNNARSGTGNATLMLAGVSAVLPELEKMAKALTDPKIAKQLEAAKELEKSAYATNAATQQRLRELNGQDAAAKLEYSRMIRQAF